MESLKNIGRTGEFRRRQWPRIGRWLSIGLFASMWAATVAHASPPVFRGNSSQFTLLEPARPAPDAPLRGLRGELIELSQLKGKVVLLNFWATWCAPCIYELPSLDRLTAATAEDGQIAVIAVSIDDDSAAVAPFMTAHGLAHLPVYTDTERRLGSLSVDPVPPDALPLYGLPITYVIDPKGRVVGYLVGTAAWDSAKARALLDHVAKD